MVQGEANGQVSSLRKPRLVVAACVGVIVASSGFALAWQSVQLTGTFNVTATKAVSGPSQVSRLLANAKPGQVIVLPSSARGETIGLTNRHFSPAIRIDARNALLSGVVIRNSSGIILSGGTVMGPGGRSYGINISHSKNIRVEDMTISGAHRGIVMGRSQDIAVVNNQLVGLIAEGVNIALSQRVLIQGNRCANFNPTPATRDAAGNLIKDGDHPDCIQAWSRPDGTPTGDVWVVGNHIEGRMQGIFFGNHVRNGVDDGGFDRIVIENNNIRVSSYHGVTLYASRGGRVRNNQIATIPGLFNPKPPHRPVMAGLRLIGNVNVAACGNTVEGRTSGDGLARC